MTKVLDADLDAKVESEPQAESGLVREWYGDLMALHGTKVGKQGEEMTPVWVAFCTNGSVKSDGEAVMGVGVARHMKEKYPTMPGVLGKLINPQEGGRNQVVRFAKAAVFTFPHQENWRQAPALGRIAATMRQLRGIVDAMPEITKECPLYVERPGYQPDATKSLPWPKVIETLVANGADERFVFVAPVAAKQGAGSVVDADL